MSVSHFLERPLGPQEALFGELNRRANGGVQLTSIAEFVHPVEAESLWNALRSVHERHPMLRARMEDRDRLWWVCDVPFERIDIRTQGCGPTFNLETFYADEAEKPLDVSQVSWRAVLLTNETGGVGWLALTANHAAVDGRSALVLLNDLDRFVEAPADFPRGPLPLAKSAESALANAGSTGQGGLYQPWPKEANWAVEQPSDSMSRKPHALLRVLPRRDLDSLHERVHREGLTLAAAFCAAAVQAGTVLPGSTPWIGLLVTTDVRGDCRPPVPGDAVGEYVASINLLLGPEQPKVSPIETARRLEEQLKTNRPRALQMETDVSPQQIREQADSFAKASPVFAGGVCVADMGDFNRLAGRRVGISRVLLMPSQNHGVHPILVAIVSTSQGASLSFGYAEPLRSRGNAVAFADRYLEALAGFNRQQ